MTDRYTYKQYVRHAERYGVEDLYEVAADDLTPRELVQLVGQLRRIDQERHDAEFAARVRHKVEPPWTLPRDAARALVAEFGADEDRVNEKWVAGMLGISRQTVRNYLKAALEAAESDETGLPQGPGQVPAPAA